MHIENGKVLSEVGASGH